MATPRDEMTTPAQTIHLRAIQDQIQPFQIEGQRVRGRLVRLGPSVTEVLERHEYPEPVAALLAELLALAAVLAGALKYEGVFTLQTKGDGPVRLMVADVTSAGDVRGYAQFDADQVAALPAGSGPSVPRLLGAGYLAFTVDQGSNTERYQGIVELAGSRLADCVHHYFRQSEQLQAGIKVAAGRGTDEEGTPLWRASALMLQRMPVSGGHGLEENEENGRTLLGEAGDSDEGEEDWRRALTLMGSATTAELLDPDLASNDLLYRLFHEEGVRVFSPGSLRAACRCSRDRVERVLRSLDRDELKELEVDGGIVVTCEFCNGRYRFSDGEVDALFDA